MDTVEVLLEKPSYRYSEHDHIDGRIIDVFKGDSKIGSLAYELCEECYVFTHLEHGLKMILSPSLLKSKQQIRLNF